jgi:hypothetical protein
MNLESFPMAVFVTALVFTTIFISLPLVATAMSRISLETPVKSSDTSGGAACDLPPSVELEGKEKRPTAGELPAMDKKRAKEFKTATFAMG